MMRALKWAAFGLLLTAAAALADITGGGGPGVVVSVVNAVFGVTTVQPVCNGSTDNAAYLQSRINAASGSSASTVFFMPALSPCMLASNITVPSNVSLWAFPGSVTLKVAAGNTSTPLLLNINNASNVSIYGLTLDGGGYGTSAFGNTNNVNQAFNSQYIVFDHVTVQNTAGAGIVFSTKTSYSGVRDSSFNNVGITQATFTGTISTTTLTVNSGQVGTILTGATISCVGCSYQTTIVSGSGPTYTITPSQTVGPVSMTATYGKQGVAFCCGVLLDTPGSTTSSISGTTLTTGNSQTSAIIGQYVYGTQVLPDTKILSGSGSSWTVSVSQTVAATALQAALNNGNFTTTTSFNTTGLDSVSYTQERDFSARLNNITNAGVSSAAGIYDHYNDTTVLIGNIINNANGNGIDLAGTSNASVVGNTIKMSGGAGIAYAWASHAVVTGNVSIDNYQTKNTTTNPAQAGLFLSGTSQPVTYVTICDNDFSDLQTTPTQTYGIQMQSGSTASNIYICPSNTFFGNVTAKIAGPVLGAITSQSTITIYTQTSSGLVLPANTNLVRFITIGQGGCGGGGIAVASGASVSGGGGGGGSELKDTGWLQASLLTGTGTVTISTQCTSAAAGASGSVGGNAQIAWTGLDTQISYGGGGGALGISASSSGGGGGAGAIAVGGSTTTSSAGGAGGGGGNAGGSGANGSNGSFGGTGGGGGIQTAAAGSNGGIAFSALGSSGGGAGGGCSSGTPEAGGVSYSPGTGNSLAAGAATGAQGNTPTSTANGYAGWGGSGGGANSTTSGTGGVGGSGLPGGGGGGGGSACATSGVGGAGGVGGAAEVIVMTQ